jgi:hypothetical protein
VRFNSDGEAANGSVLLKQTDASRKYFQKKIEAFDGRLYLLLTDATRSLPYALVLEEKDDEEIDDKSKVKKEADDGEDIRMNGDEVMISDVWRALGRV